MPDPAKPNFWQTIPGLITATAGLLSAATGVLVSLNQTGVIDLRKSAGMQPAAQSAPAMPKTAPTSPEGEKSAAKLDNESSIAEARRQDQGTPSPARLADEPARAAPGAVTGIGEPRTQGTVPTPSAASTGEPARPAIQPESRPVETLRREEQPSAAPPVQDKSVPAPTYTGQRAAVPESQEKPLGPSVSPAGDAGRPGGQVESRPVETPGQEERRMPLPPVQEKPTPPKTDYQERLVEPKKPGGFPPPVTPSAGDAARPPAPAENRRVETPQQQERPSTTAPPQERVTPPRTDPRERVVEAKKPQEPAASPQTKQDEVKPPKSAAQPPASEGKKQDQSPADSSPRGDTKRLTPEAAARVAEARKQEQSPARPPLPDAEVKKAKPGVQQPDEPASAGKAKTPAADPKQKTRIEQKADEEKDPRRATPDDRKKPDPTPGPPTATTGSQLALTGLKLSVPNGWVKEEGPSSTTASVAVLRIPKADPGSADGTVRITHDPSVKGKEMVDRSIDRLLGQVAKPDGSPITRAEAKIATTQLGPIRVITVDLTGTVKTGVRDPGKPGHRMLAAILDHPQGPHFIVAVGPAPSMQKWASAIDAFIRSAKAE